MTIAKRSLTLADIRSTYTEEKRAGDKNNLWGYFILRPISHYPTWLCLRLGISANRVTGISFLIGLIGCGFLAFGGYTGVITGAVIMNIWALLEFVDGNVARCNNSCTSYGAFVDDLNAYTISALFFISAGVGAFHHPDPWLNSLAINIDSSLFLFLGGWAALFYILPRFIGNLFTKIFPADEGVSGSGLLEDISSSTLRRINFNINNIVGLVMPVLLLAAIFRFLSVFILIWALIPTGAFIVLVPKLLRRGRAIGS